MKIQKITLLLVCLLTLLTSLVESSQQLSWQNVVCFGKGKNLSFNCADDDTCTAIWDAVINNVHHIAAVYYTPNLSDKSTGTWSVENGGSPDIISEPGATESTLSGNLTGDSVAAWKTLNGEIAVRFRKNGVWSNAEIVSVPGQFSDSPKVVMNQIGQVYLIWRGSNAGNRTLEALFRSASGIWQPRQTLVSDFLGTGLVIKMNVLGNAIAGFIGSEQNVYVARTTAANTWTLPPEQITDNYNTITRLSVFISDLGGYIVAWQVQENVNLRSRSRYILHGTNTWVPDLSDPDGYDLGTGGFPSIAGNVGSGNAVVTFGAQDILSKIFNASSGYTFETNSLNPPGLGGRTDTAGNTSSHVVAVWPVENTSGVYSNFFTPANRWLDGSQAVKVYDKKSLNVSVVINSLDALFAGGETTDICGS